LHNIFKIYLKMSVISLTDIPYIVVIYGSCLIALVWAAIQATEVNKIQVTKDASPREDGTEALNENV
jgi:hypothetical protein